MLVQKGNLACTSFPPQWNELVRDVVVLLPNEKLVCTIFSRRWSDVV
jgi:hypothetical protein